LILASLIDATSPLRWASLNLDPTAVNLGFFKIRWYSLAYITGIIVGWWYLVKLLSQPGSPMAKRHADDLIFFATLGIILGGRLGYCLFYQPQIFLTPTQILKVWEGGMSFHGGVLGVVIALFWLVRKEKLSWLRVHDYVACCVPPGMLFGRLANFVNGELWGRETTLPWGMIFPGGGEVVRHPSQLYEAGLEGLVLGIILWVMFWKTDARYQPGKLVGTFALFMGLFRFLVETVREPDVGVTGLLGLTMGQTLCLPLILIGGYLVATAKARRQRVESVAGSSSVA
jgi:phosphatidylglycerol---prolipoprotein diacylglyceryl transferase